MSKLTSYIEGSNHKGLSSYLVLDEEESTRAISPGEGFDTDNLISDYIAGLPARYLQAKYNMSAGQIFSHIRARGVPFRYDTQTETRLMKRLKHITPEQMFMIVQDYKQGVPNKTIYEKYNIHKNGLYTLLDANQVKRKTRGDK